MKTLHGIGASDGIAFGKIYYKSQSGRRIERRVIEDAGAELARFESARQQALRQLEELYEQALSKVGEEGAAIFTIHSMMLEDEDYLDFIHDLIQTQRVDARYALSAVAESFSRVFAEMDSDDMKTRAADVRDVSERVMDILAGEREAGQLSGGPVILAAEDIPPSETVRLDKESILGIITAGGAYNSHTAILARMMGIPAVIAAGEGLAGLDGLYAALDAQEGVVYLEPDDETISRLKSITELAEQRKILLGQLRGLDNVTVDGTRIDIFANVGSQRDIDLALENDAGGIGLLRSEYLYLEARTYPNEETLFSAYKAAAEKMPGKRVVIRTLDIGGDKGAGYFNLPKEDNPALGYRAIRVCLDQPHILITQLRALLRAAVFGNIAIMFPMITSTDELRELKEILRQASGTLKSEEIPHSCAVELGVMIETPAAALISDLLAKEVDFFSIGTNDLAQFTLAADRQNPLMERYYNQKHDAVLRLIRTVAENARRENVRVNICGELAADHDMTEFFLRSGIDGLSVAPGDILPLREKIRNIRL